MCGLARAPATIGLAGRQAARRRDARQCGMTGTGTAATESTAGGMGRSNESGRLSAGRVAAPPICNCRRAASMPACKQLRRGHGSGTVYNGRHSDSDVQHGSLIASLAGQDPDTISAVSGRIAIIFTAAGCSRNEDLIADFLSSRSSSGESCYHFSTNFITTRSASLNSLISRSCSLYLCSFSCHPLACSL